MLNKEWLISMRIKAKNVKKRSRREEAKSKLLFSLFTKNNSIVSLLLTDH
jgi:hypothetical protein